MYIFKDDLSIWEAHRPISSSVMSEETALMPVTTHLMTRAANSLYPVNKEKVSIRLSHQRKTS